MTENPSDKGKVQSTSKPESFANESIETLGKHLKRTRKSLHKSIKEVAEATRIHSSTIKALEEDDRSKLPAEVFTRGFIKIYAGYLGLDPQDALRWYDQKEEIPWTGADENINAQEVLASETLAESPSLITVPQIILIITAVLVIFFGFLVYRTYQSLPIPSEEPSESVAEVPSPPPLPSTQAVPADIDKVPAAQEETQETNQDRETEDISTPLQQEAPAEALKEEKTLQAEQPVEEKEEYPLKVDEPPPPPADKQPVPAVTSLEPAAPSDQQKQQEAETTDEKATAAAIISPAASSGESSTQEKIYNYKLEAQFSEVTWMRVQIDNQRPREFTYQPGDEHVWRAVEKIELFIGNAGGVTMTLNEEPLPTLGKSGQIYKLTIPTTSNP